MSFRKKKFEFKKCGDFTPDESQNEYKRQLNERTRIASLRAQNRIEANEEKFSPDENLCTKPGAKGWSKTDYKIQLNTGAVSKDADPFALPGTAQYNQFARTPRCGDNHSEQSTMDTYKTGINTAKHNAQKLSGSAAREIITFEGSSAQRTPATGQQQPASSQSWDEGSYRVKIATRVDSSEPVINTNAQHKTFARNPKCGDGFNVDASKQAFRLAKMEALKISQKTNGGGAARDALTQRGRKD